MNNCIRDAYIDDVDFDSMGGATTICIFAVGYESRSIHLYENKFKGKFSKYICLHFGDADKYEVAQSNIKLITDDDIVPIEITYSDNLGVTKLIQQELTDFIDNGDRICVHVDYSSMPRGWYTRLPVAINSCLRTCDESFFWYAHGQYEDNVEYYPSAGIDQISVYKGIATLRPVNNRTHVLGLGYDCVRSQAIFSVLDPSYLVVCYTHPAHDASSIAGNVKKENQELFATAAYSFALPIEDFTFSLSKLCETANELIESGDVIFVPDGPKPLIMATSLVPDILNKKGIICFHVNRLDGCYQAVDVVPTGEVTGFSFKGELRAE